MTWVDGVIVLVLLISGFLAFARGFVREVLGIGAWIGAAALAVWATPFIRPRFAVWLHAHPEFAEPAAYAAVFIIALIVLLAISHAVSRVVRDSALGGLDRTLGLLFGLARGAAFVILAYIIGGWLAGPPRDWPRPVRGAMALQPTYQGAAWVVRQLPPNYQPRLYAPAGWNAPAEALLRAAPVGRATDARPSVTQAGGARRE